MPVLLGIETSCDETAAAVVEDGCVVRSSVVLSQIPQHQPYHGVVPEIASRSHVENLPGIVEAALDEADTDWDGLDGIAVTRGPGLASSLLIGVAAAKSLALSRGLPLIGVNHLEGHVASMFLGGTDDAIPPPEEACPMTLLLVSGGHTMIVHMPEWGRYEVLGRTVDDAAGEALDKGARILGLSYPGGPAIEKAAEGGAPDAVDFPRGRMREGRTGGLDPKLCFSFSGLKTSLLYHVKQHPDCVEDGLADLAASYQQAVVDALLQRVDHALGARPAGSFACVGGVARNKALRAGLDHITASRGVRLLLAEPRFCTDNAAMIAGAAGRYPLPEQFENFDVDPNLGLGA